MAEAREEAREEAGFSGFVQRARRVSRSFLPLLAPSHALSERGHPWSRLEDERPEAEAEAEARAEAAAAVEAPRSISPDLLRRGAARRARRADPAGGAERRA